MTSFSISIDIEASPDRVSVVLFDVERWPDWTSTVPSVRRLESGPFTVGSRAQVRQPMLLPGIWEVTELDQRSFTWISGSPGVQVT